MGGGGDRGAARRARLVTLTGPGGSGKTRLALEVATTRVAVHPDGVWLVELAALTGTTSGGAQLVARAVAGVLGVGEQPGQSLLTTLAEFLRPRDLLLVLDNCEHLIEACAELATTLLAACPGCALATSREGLRVPASRATWCLPSRRLIPSTSRHSSGWRRTKRCSCLWSERGRGDRT